MAFYYGILLWHFTKAILDSLTVNQCNRVNLEAASRQFLFSLHSKRQHILNTAPE